MEAGAVSKQAWQAGSFRISGSLLQGFGFEGSHPETKGLSPTGQVIQVPLHEHVVKLDFTRIELAARYGIAEDWQVIGRLPYDIKRQRSRVRFIAPATAAEKQAMLRNMEIHHRDETYYGFSDASVLGARRHASVLSNGDVLILAAGSSIPIGRTESDPFEAGDRGEQHRHIQFGTGTFDPLLEVTYRLPLPAEFWTAAHLTGRFPFYENRKTYRGPIEATASATLGYALLSDLDLHTGYLLYYQSFAHWDGKRDINTGLVAHMATAGVSFRPTDGSAVGLHARIPIAQQPLGDGDAFEQGLTLILNGSLRF